MLKNYLLIFLISMVPIIELRGAIPAGTAAGLDPWLACAAAIVGNSVRHRHNAVKMLKIRFFISFLHQSDWCIHRMHQGDIPLRFS